jgi:hypothetical protein
MSILNHPRWSSALCWSRTRPRRCASLGRYAVNAIQGTIYLFGAHDLVIARSTSEVRKLATHGAYGLVM